MQVRLLEVAAAELRSLKSDRVRDVPLLAVHCFALCSHLFSLEQCRNKIGQLKCTSAMQAVYTKKGAIFFRTDRSAAETSVQGIKMPI